jgi:tetratricopeptide (TPR) repeat protein/TolB-like protein
LPKRPKASAATAPKPSEDEIRRQLERIIASPAFETSQRNRKFLRYVVEETLAGRAERIKAYSVATVVFERDSDFDPQTDPIIRIEASRLRRALDHYYLAAGRSDPVRIVVPKGSYVPLFEYAPASFEATARQSRTARPAIAAALTARAALVAGGAAIVAVIGTAIYMAWSTPGAPLAASGAAPYGRGVSIAVAPFEITSAATEHDRSLADRLARSVTDRLTRFPDLFVFTQQSGGEAPATDYVVNASGDSIEGMLRVSLGLADGRTRQVLWSANFETIDIGAGRLRRIEDLAARMVREIAGPRGAIFAQQARTVASQPIGAATPYQCVLRYQVYWRQPTRMQLAEAHDCLQQAVKVDPAYASAHAALALARLDSIRLREVPRHAWRPVLDSALASARRAVDLAPSHPRGYEALQQVKWLQGEVEQSFVAGERAMELNPNDPEIMAGLGFRYGLRAEWPKAIPLLEQAFAADPDLPSMYRQVTSLHRYTMGQYEEALAEAKRIDLPDYVYAHVLRAIAYAKSGRSDEARTSVQRIIALEPRFAETMAEDLRARSVHPTLIRAIADGLRVAGLETPEIAEGRQ